MAWHWVTIASSLLALIVGGVIGLGFGTIQNTARRRNEQLERDGRLKSGWSIMPGSGARVAYLLIVLALIQVVCPLIFANGIQWWVSGGVLLGYGTILFQQLQVRRKASRP
jgi:hypothetical protein